MIVIIQWIVDVIMLILIILSLVKAFNTRNHGAFYGFMAALLLLIRLWITK